MFKSGPNYSKLKTNLRLTINRLKLLEKKKTELALKARKEIADYISAGKEDRARIRVEHIIREDYLVEAMELLEMYCDLLLARFGLIQTQKELDPGLEEAIASLIWATPRLQADIVEFKPITDEFTAKYGKEFALACRSNSLSNVSEKVLHKLSVQAPPKTLVEQYMVEIAKSYNVPFEPDASVMAQDEIALAENMLIDFGAEKNGNSGGGVEDPVEGWGSCSRCPRSRLTHQPGRSHHPYQRPLRPASRTTCLLHPLQAQWAIPGPTLTSPLPRMRSWDLRQTSTTCTPTAPCQCSPPSRRLQDTGILRSFPVLPQRWMTRFPTFPQFPPTAFRTRA